MCLKLKIINYSYQKQPKVNFSSLQLVKYLNMRLILFNVLFIIAWLSDF